MAEPVGALPAVEVDADRLPGSAECRQADRMADPDGLERTLVLPPTPEPIGATYGAKGALV
jgi:hypothetical protein